MDQFTTMYIPVAEEFHSAVSDRVDEEVRALNRAATRRHLRHLGAWLVRAVLLALVFYAGNRLIVSGLGDVVSWAAIAMAPLTLLYAIKGHRDIRRMRMARLYWLRQAAGDCTVKSAQPVTEEKETTTRPHLIVASLPQQDEYDDVGWVKKQALS